MTEQDRRGSLSKLPELTEEQRAELASRYGVTDRVNVSDQMRELRNRQGLKQSEIARRMGLDPSIPSLWEQGRRLVPLNRLMSLAEALEATPEELLGLKGKSGATLEQEPTIEVAVQPPAITPKPTVIHSPVVWDDPDLTANHLPLPRVVAPQPTPVDPLPQSETQAEVDPEIFVPPERPPLNGWTPQDWEPTDRIQDIGPDLPDGYWLDPVRLEKPPARELLRSRLCSVDQALIEDKDVPGASLAERIYRHCSKQPEYLPAESRRYPLVETIFRQVLAADHGGLSDGALVEMLRERQDGVPVTVTLLRGLRDSVRSYPMRRVDPWLFGR